MESECFPCIPLTRASHEPFTIKSEPLSPPTFIHPSSPSLSSSSSSSVQTTSLLADVKQEPGIQVSQMPKMRKCRNLVLWQTQEFRFTAQVHAARFSCLVAAISLVL